MYTITKRKHRKERQMKSVFGKIFVVIFVLAYAITDVVCISAETRPISTGRVIYGVNYAAPGYKSNRFLYDNKSDVWLSEMFPSGFADYGASLGGAPNLLNPAAKLLGFTVDIMYSSAATPETGTKYSASAGDPLAWLRYDRQANVTGSFPGAPVTLHSNEYEIPLTLPSVAGRLYSVRSRIDIEWLGQPMEVALAQCHDLTPLYTAVPAFSGDVVTAIKEFNTTKLYINGELVQTKASNESHALYVLFKEWDYEFYNPTGNFPELRKEVNSSVDWLEDISGAWGYTTGNMILPDGTGGLITDLSVDGFNNDGDLSFDGTTYDYIGAKIHNYKIQDSNALRTDSYYSYDNTETLGDRKISVYTTAAPDLNITYGTDADPLLIGQPYDANSLVPLPCGGEDGWTNQPLDISVDPGSIPGNFDTVLRKPTDAETTVPNGIATFDNYDTETPVAGTTVEGILTERDDATNELSSLVSGKIKIDTTLPIPNASHQGGISFTDLSDDAPKGSGKSSTRPSLIALVPAGTVTPPEKTDATSFAPEDIGPKVPGLYDVYVWAFDKAGNEAVEMVGTYEIDGEVIIRKDTDLGATLHSLGCGNSESLEWEAGCTSNCAVGATQGIVENTDFNYELTIENTDTTKNAAGTFTDYLPKGFAKTMTTPTITGIGITNTSATFIEDGGVNDGQWCITGNYALPAGESTKVSIAVTAPKHADIENPSKILSNQADITWTLDPSGTPKSGTATSNYANHEITASPSVETKFKKVGADDIAAGITGAKFALYKWTGDDTDYIGHDNDILDRTALDGGEISGLWRRAKKDAEDGAITDFFDTDALGEVVLGELPTGTYTLIETRSPNGYELPVGQWTLVVNASNTDSGDNDWKIEYKAKSGSTLPPAVIRVPGSGGNPPSYRIVNTKPFSVGMTGMNGTAGFISLGLGLMVMAGIIYSVHQFKKRKSRTISEDDDAA